MVNIPLKRMDYILKKRSVEFEYVIVGGRLHRNI